MTPGTKVGGYEILALIGAGGMGEVYRARDTKLKREVALKVLPEAFAGDPERMARFQREAEVLASLNHPNIAQIYGVEDRALVMELVEGESPKGPMPFDEAWKIALQIAAGLEYAHEKGIVHRDLKPANIKVTPDGIVKLLDFGLAKAFTAQTVASGNLENSPTLTLGATQLGVILGTAAYMAPEQAKGKAVDKRADVWSFGVVLYELLTGERLFKGDDASDTLAQVLTKQPDLDSVPFQARRLLRQCLQKDPKERLRDIGDAKHQLVEEVQPSPLPIPMSTPSRSRPGIISTTAALVFGLVAGVLAWVHLREKPAAVQVMRFEIGPPKDGRFTNFMSISPDGRKIAFTAVPTANFGGPRLWIRSLDSPEAKALVDTATLPFPFWSPDGRFVALQLEGKLKKLDVAGGPAETLCEIPGGDRNFGGGSWNSEGTIIFGTANGGLRRVSASGGDAAALTALDSSRQETGHLHPIFLPDGHHFLYVRLSSQPENSGVYIGSLDANTRDPAPHRLLATTLPAQYAAAPGTGYLLFMRESTLYSQPFDAGKLALSGEPVPIAESVTVSAGQGYFSASANGILVYRTGQGEINNSNLHFTWLDRQGKELAQMGSPALYTDGRLSPDGSRVATVLPRAAGSDIWLVDSRGVSSRFTFDPHTNGAPVWSLDGSRIAFGSNRAGHVDLYQKPSNGAGEDALLFKSDEDKAPLSWSRDGRFLLFESYNPKTYDDLWLLPLDGDTKPIPVAVTNLRERLGRFSPDSRWIAYISSESGRPEVFVRPFNRPGSTATIAGKWQISKDGVAYLQPRWSNDGRELFFVDLRGNLMAVEVHSNPVFQFGIPQTLFRLPLGINNRGWDVGADGKRFLVVAPPDFSGPTQAPVPFTVVLNWQAALKK